MSSGFQERAVSSPISSEHIAHQPNDSSPALPWSPTSVTQGLSNPGSFPASESQTSPTPQSVPPLMLPKKGFEIREFNMNEDPVAHENLVLTARNDHRSPMSRLFDRIKANDRVFIQQLPVSAREQEKLGFFLDRHDKATGHTPLIAALAAGHLDLAVDLMMQGASPSALDRRRDAPAKVIGDEGMACMVVQFMLRYEEQESPSALITDKGLSKLLTKIDTTTGHTLLTWAISKHHDELVERLIDSGADFRVANRFGKTALVEACSSGSVAAIRLLLKSVGTFAVALQQQHLISAIYCTVDANRPMVLAPLLSFLRDVLRSQEELPGDADDNPVDSITSNPSTQQDAHAFFLGGWRASSATLDVIMARTSDSFLLTEKESLLLELDKVVVIAEERGLTKIVEIIHAHAKLPKGS